MSYISKENLERQISEMWDAVNQIPANDPDRDYAINQAQECENKMREAYLKQEKLRDAAPELLDALKVCYASLKTYGNHPIIEKQVDYAINKAQ